jgi:hypothetical protein
VITASVRFVAALVKTVTALVTRDHRVRPLDQRTRHA